MKIYTKTGDLGETSLLTGSRVTKDCINLKVNGELDELSSVLGIIVSICHAEFISEFNKEILKLVQGGIIRIQKDLFKIGVEVSSLQNAIENASVNASETILEKDIKSLEKQIDEMEKELPELKNFILPGGSVFSANLHLARSICRRTERELVHFGKEVKIRPEVFGYLNRLSDLLFVMARFVNFKSGVKESII